MPRRFSPISITDLPADIVLGRLHEGGFRIDGEGPWQASCPAHADSRPSLSITEEDDGTLLIYCHAGCDPAHILAELDLDLSHLYPSPFSQFSKGRPECRRSYPGNRTVCVDEPTIDFNRLAAIHVRALENSKGAVKRLAKRLGLPFAALCALRVGHSDRGYVFPEVDELGRICAIVYRDDAGDRQSESGSKRAITAPLNWANHEGPIYLAEGASDTAALWSTGAAVLGRPAAKASARVRRTLFRMLRAFSDRKIIIVGDNDPVVKGQSAGRDGARSLAVELEKSLNRPVRWALPQRQYKDVREQICAGAWNKGLTFPARRPQT